MVGARARQLWVVLAAALPAACASPGVPPDDAGARPVPDAAYARFPAPSVPADNPTTEPRVELGRQLFHDPVLSSDRRVACVTCHGEIWGMSDGLPVSVGVGGVGPPGPGRRGPNVTTRNAQTLWNVAWRAELFWDGRAPSLEAQALFPMRAPNELGRAPDDVVADLRALPGYAPLFRAAFPDEPEPVTVANMARALAAFERTLVSDRAPWDQYVRGDLGAMGAPELRGWALFTAARCDSCHTPPLFASERYEPATAGTDPADPGRYEHTRADADRGRFRVPTLRNLRVTEPYLHDGSARTLDEAVAREVASGRGGRALDADEVALVATFLRKGLMDITRLPDRPRYAPSGLQVPVDTLEIPRWGDGDGGTPDAR